MAMNQNVRKLRKILGIGMLLVSALLKVTTYASEGVPQEDKKVAHPFTVCIDPGHQAKGDSKTEPIAPGSSQRKARVASGTAGVATKKAEYVVNLEAALKLKELLVEQGYTVVMTRETHDVNISNAERAQLANTKKADMTVRIHCDSISNGGKTGATIIVPAKEGHYTQAIYPKSYAFATCLKEALEESSVKVNGIFERSDMTGFNWSTVPVVILEMGFMSNYQEDQMLSDPSYQQKLMQATTKALGVYRDNQTQK